MDDTSLLDRSRRGDEQAFSELFGRYQHAIHRYGAYMCGPEAGDDVVQDTFLAVLRQTGRRDRPTGTVMSYLLGIARHIVMKRWSARNAVPFDGLGDERLNETVAANAPSSLEGLIRADTIASVRTAVYSLPAGYREVVVLCELQDMDYAAAAQVMECPIGTIRSRLHRARALLMSKLAASRAARCEESGR